GVEATTVADRYDRGAGQRRLRDAPLCHRLPLDWSAGRRCGPREQGGQVLRSLWLHRWLFFFFQAEDGIRDWSVTGVQTCALPIWRSPATDCSISRATCSTSGASPGSLITGRLRPCRNALRATAALPAAVFGPVLA